MDATLLLYLLGALLLGLIIGLSAGFILTRRSQQQALDIAREQLRDSFSALANDALRSNKQDFLQLAQENLSRFQTEAKGDLAQKQQAFSELIKPINEALKKTEHQIQSMEKDRKHAFGGITEHLRIMQESQEQLRTQTGSLVNALRRPEVRGRWGEITLKRLAELAGMVDRCDFEEQVNVQGDDERLRPDMVVRLPDNRELVVDAKTPLDSYLTAIEATTDAKRTAALVAHARKVRERVRELAKKQYWQQFKKSPEFVILFIPGEQFLAAALDQEPGLLDDALRDQVIIATPTSFMALLKAVAYGWRQASLAENAEQIRDHARELHDRLATFGEHLEKVGRSLGASVDAFNKSVGSLERQVLPSARRFRELGVQTKKQVPELNPLDHTTRKPEIPNDND
ncbi:MAG TPA: DNA recombination protein RmuC [Gammaproteobacteria bacterium]|nr:DNA recombination protein RmuC [Gammaproteobacteria bacterium]